MDSLLGLHDIVLEFAHPTINDVSMNELSHLSFVHEFREFQSHFCKVFFDY